jgi:site-specific DNA-adenine methylase
MAERYGIVYMGSKEKILNLISYINSRHYDAKYFIDLFTGGLTVSSYILKNTKKQVIANDLNHYVIALYKEVLSGSKNLDNIKFNFVDRETFEYVKNNPDMYPEWYVGFVLNMWSFGCNQKDYLYAKDLEYAKKAIHQAIVFDDFEEFEKLFPNILIPVNIREIDYKKHKKKRTHFMKYLKDYMRDNPNELYARLEHSEQLAQVEHLTELKSLIPHKERLSLSSVDWKFAYDFINKSVLENSIIYCDPPYQDTKQYQFGNGFDYDEFWNWFRECPYPVYVSSYKAPDDIKPLNFDFKHSLLDNGKQGSGKKKNLVTENIYWNGKGNPEPTLEDLLFGDKNEEPAE